MNLLQNTSLETTISLQTYTLTYSLKKKKRYLSNSNLIFCLFLKKLNIELPYELPIYILGIQPPKTWHRDSDFYTQMFTPALLTMVETTQHPATSEWINSTANLHTTILSVSRNNGILRHSTNGWTLRTLCYVKQARHNKTNTVWLRAYKDLEQANAQR